VWIRHEATYSAERVECYRAGGAGGKAEVMSEADVEWSIESFNVPGLQRNHDEGGVGRRKVGGDRTGWV